MLLLLLLLLKSFLYFTLFFCLFLVKFNVELNMYMYTDRRLLLFRYLTDTHTHTHTHTSHTLYTYVYIDKQTVTETKRNGKQRRNSKQKERFDAFIGKCGVCVCMCLKIRLFHLRSLTTFHVEMRIFDGAFFAYIQSFSFQYAWLYMPHHPFWFQTTSNRCHVNMNRQQQIHICVFCRRTTFTTFTSFTWVRKMIIGTQTWGWQCR